MGTTSNPAARHRRHAGALGAAHGEEDAASLAIAQRLAERETARHVAHADRGVARRTARSPWTQSDSLNIATISRSPSVASLRRPM